jgi:hypothetical protein
VGGGYPIRCRAFGPNGNKAKRHEREPRTHCTLGEADVVLAEDAWQLSVPRAITLRTAFVGWVTP